jgi:hypothetical protein
VLGEPVSDTGQELLVDARTGLAFFVMQTHSGWMVRADGAVYGPYSCSKTALAAAVDEAQAAGIFGFASVVLLRSTIGQPYAVRWLYGHDPYPPI